MLAKCTPNDSVRNAPTGTNTKIELRGPVKRLNDNCELYICEWVGRVFYLGFIFNCGAFCSIQKKI